MNSDYKEHFYEFKPGDLVSTPLGLAILVTANYPWWILQLPDKNFVGLPVRCLSLDKRNAISARRLLALQKLYEVDYTDRSVGTL